MTPEICFEINWPLDLFDFISGGFLPFGPTVRRLDSRNWEDESYVTHRKVTFGPLRSSVIETPWKAPKSPLNKSNTIKFFFLIFFQYFFSSSFFPWFFYSLSESVAIRNNDRITDTNRPFFQSAPSLKSFFFKTLLLFDL